MTTMVEIQQFTQNIWLDRRRRWRVVYRRQRRSAGFFGTEWGRKIDDDENDHRVSHTDKWDGPYLRS